MESIWPETSALFTERLNVKVRPEMRADLDRIAQATGLTTSDVVRWVLQVGIESFNDRSAHAEV